MVDAWPKLSRWIVNVIPESVSAVVENEKTNKKFGRALIIRILSLFRLLVVLASVLRFCFCGVFSSFG